MASNLISKTPAWQALTQHAAEDIAPTHLRTLLQDSQRCRSMTLEYDGVFLDFSRQRVTSKTMDLLFDLAETADVLGKIKAMRDGIAINTTENRPVLHIALRASADQSIIVNGKNVVADVHRVLEKIRVFSERVRSGELVGATGKPLTQFIAIGIGGSYLGAEFVAEALHTEKNAASAAGSRQLHFLANVDPVHIARAIEGFNPETTLAIVISKTFTTAETMLNARSVRQWLVDKLGERAVAKHMVAVSTNLPLVQKFGIDPNNAFEFWDWVGGRYSVCSAVGLLPLSLKYGFKIVEQFLSGARSVDNNFFTAPPRQNMPLVLGLLGVWNSSFLKYPTRAIAAYSQALHKFAPHIQQVDMESNGKRVTIDGVPLDFDAGEINFGEPGTNGQHSFFQLIHQGRVIPVDFIGFTQSQYPVEVKGESVANHDELMANFFAQPDALAVGKNPTPEDMKAERADERLIPHKTFPGNRPSNVLLLPKLTAFEVGQLLALYEHRTAVEGFVWGINSFDQFGVELGKVLAGQVRKQVTETRRNGKSIQGFNPSTTALLSRYLQLDSKL